ncbi:YscQ/HrcQ family type III secretion apparatus protein [Yersinia kristensenii]|uniref:YscQ/HrcQ family type III secretion apparatus protein n=1 Tax=Yersinia kristensenii TaxID=28152 RepID=UPI001C60A960|nr:YscQ/HrcQ family type III secretion apparatus protein [Yersinia kristensenii]MBW5826836.1 YscQ/HrcQ family type III secretion apparatus protein [Yersinia kristensenii]
MMAILSAELRDISAVIGRGRHTGGVCATLDQVEGEGIYLPLHYAGTRCGLWLSQSCWHHWLASSLATENPHLLAAELVSATAAWAVSPLSVVLPELAIDAPAPVAMTLLPQWAVVLAFELEGQSLRGVLYDWPLAALAETFSDWHRELATEHNLRWQAELVVGWSRLSLHQLQQIRPGDGVRINGAAEWEQGNCWLWPMASPQIYIKLEDGNRMIIQQVNDDIDSLLALDIAALPKMPPAVQLEQLPQTLIMEIGRLTLPLSDIKQLDVGQTLACQTHLYGEVNIRLHGQIVGSGSLLCCDGQMVVRIDQWFIRHT